MRRRIITLDVDHEALAAWTAVVGPTAAAIYRAMASIQAADNATLAALVGVSAPKASAALNRLHRYGLIGLTDTLIEMRALHPLTHHQRRRLHPAHPLHLSDAR